MSEENNEYIQQKCFELLCFVKKVCESSGIWYSLAFGTMLGAVRHQGFIPWDTDVDIFVTLPDKKLFRETIKKNLTEDLSFDDFDAQPHNMKSHDVLKFLNKDKENIHLDIYYLCGCPDNKREQARFAFITSYTDRIIRSKYNRLMDCKKKNRILVFFAKIIDYCFPDFLLKKYIKHNENKYDFAKSNYMMPLANYGTATDCIPKTVFAEMIQQPFNGMTFAIPSKYDVYLCRTYGSDYMTPKKY